MKSNLWVTIIVSSIQELNIRCLSNCTAKTAQVKIGQVSKKMWGNVIREWILESAKEIEILSKKEKVKKMKKPRDSKIRETFEGLDSKEGALH